MCHHFLLPDQLTDEFAAPFAVGEAQKSAYVAVAGKLKALAAWPLKPIPTLRLDKSGELEVAEAEWGLLPRWWKPSDKMPKRSTFQRKTINARSETAHEKPTFRDALKQRRCLVPIAEFEEKGHYFGLGEPMAFAGLWENWLADEGEITTCTFLTSEPNAEVRGVGHHRMPVLLTTSAAREEWLVEGLSEPMRAPFGDGLLAVREKG